MTTKNAMACMLSAGALLFADCGGQSTKPVDIYPEDMCSYCRMAFSDQRFASEIISKLGEVYKFDDIECMDEFRRKSADLEISAVYYRDFETREWIPSTTAVVVETDLFSPMGSGKAAFRDSIRAKEFMRVRHPL
jgi:copper chaperone NosL